MADTKIPPLPRELLHPKHWLVWAGVGVLMLLTRLPYRAQLQLGKGLGLLMHKLAVSRRHIVEVNIRLCFPEKSAQEQTALVRQVFIDNGIGVMETMIAWFRKPDYLLSRTTFHGLDKVLDAHKNGKGVMILGAHYSMLDLAGALLSTQLYFNVSYRPQNSPVMNFLMERNRARLYKNCYTRKDIRGFIRSLKKGDALWYAQDQDFGHKNSIFVDFFGIPAATITATSRIAKAGEALVIPMTYFRREDNSGYDLTFFDPLPIPGESDEADARVANAFLEEQLRQHPSQYLWLHKRFKSRPDRTEGKGNLYKRK